MWFAVPIYLKSSEPLRTGVLIEEAIHLIDAESEDEAVAKAHSLARTLEHRFHNDEGREVTWTFQELGQTWKLLDDLKDGAEVFSRLMTGEELKSMKQRFAES